MHDKHRQLINHIAGYLNAACILDAGGNFLDGNKRFNDEFNIDNDSKIIPTSLQNVLRNFYKEYICSECLLYNNIHLPNINYDTLSISPMVDEDRVEYAYIYQFISKENRNHNCAMNSILFNSKLLFQLIDILPINIYWLNTEGVLLGCNEAQALALGEEKPKKITGKKLTDLVPKYIADNLDINNKFVMKQKKILKFEETVYSLNKKFYYNSTKAPIYLNNEVVGIIGFSIDVTENKNLQKIQSEDAKKIESASIMKNEFIRNIKHDLRTPLSGIIGYAESISQVIAPEHREKIDILIASCGELVNLINMILELSNIAENPDETITIRFSMPTLIEDIRSLYAPACVNKNITLLKKIDPKLKEFYIGDARQIKQVLIDIMSNAINFTDTGEISLSVYLQEKNAVSESLVVFVIKDTGIGMTNEQLANAFNYFQRFNPSYHGKYPGLGLGLWRAKKIIEQLHGEINIISVPNTGTTVQFVLPLTESLLNVTE